MASYNRRRGRIDLTTGPIFSSLVRFTIPILLGSIVTQFYNLADSIIVGRFINANALAAVSASTPVMSIINLFLIGLSSGSTVVIAQRMGAKDEASLQRAVSTVATLTLMISILITVAGLIACKPLLRLLGTPAEIMQDSYEYLVVIYLGTLGNMIYQMGSGALRGMGDSAWPFRFLVLCSVLNVVLDLFMVLVLGWGVLGVAIATAVAQLVSGVGILFRLNRGGYDVQVTAKTLRIHKEEAMQIISIGLPAAIQNVGNSIAAMCVQSSVNQFGSVFIAANSVVTKVDDMINMPVMAMGTAVSTFVGQNMGNFNLERVKKGINYSNLSLFVLGAGLWGILIGFRNYFPLIFTDEPEVIRYASEGLLITSFSCFFLGVDRVLVNAMRGAGKSVVPMITAQFGAFSRIPLTILLASVTGNYRGVFWALLISSLLRAAAIAAYYYLGGWARAVEKIRKKREAKGEPVSP